MAATRAAPNYVGLLSRERIIAHPGYNRWLVPPAALAIRVPPPGGTAGPVQAPPQVHTIVAGGMPGWQIALIAAAAASAAAAVAVLLDRSWVARKAHATTA